MVALSPRLADDKTKIDPVTQSQNALEAARQSIEKMVFWGTLFAFLSAVLGMLW